MSSANPLDPLPEQARSLPPAWDLDSPALYLNRELTWLAFNRRVLAEAENRSNPLLERVKFLSIFDSNLDEFFMKRIGGLKQQLGAGMTTPTIDGRTPQQQILDCREAITRALAERALIYRDILAELAAAGIRIDSWETLDEEARKTVRKQYKQSVLPLVTPLAIDEAHPFPFISNLSMNLLVEMHDPVEKDPHLVRIKTPSSSRTPRLMQIGDSNHFVRLEDVIAGNLDLLFPGAAILSAAVFRVTRNAIVERDHELANDLLELIEAELRDRRFAPVVRLEVAPNLRPELRRHLIRELKFSGPEDIYEVPDMLGTRDLMQLTSLDRSDLKYPPHEPADHPRLARVKSIFDELDANGPMLLKYPYQSFDRSVTRFLKEAVIDPDVLAIKTTVYRTSEESEIIPLLIQAVTQGKQVAVVVELQARFDEAANIRWANRLEEAGIHVSYGVVGYKTHTKAILVLRKMPAGKLRRYVHIGTGNYNSVTARLYSDLAYMSSEKDIAHDATELFNLMTSGSLSGREYGELLIAPLQMKSALLDKIRRETKHHEQAGNGLIQLKTNALEDPEIVRALYEASRTGVDVDLIVRDTCRIRPGLPGLSESVRVISILGRFLEHSRIYYFHNGGAEEYYIGSADLMTRNLVSRVEALVPVRNLDLQAELREFLDLQLTDNNGTWDMDSDGNYRRRRPNDGDRHCQQIMIDRSRNPAPAESAATGRFAAFIESWE
jgi:polyphosphate kinase